jgi:hypothetical protein
MTSYNLEGRERVSRSSYTCQRLLCIRKDLVLTFHWFVCYICSIIPGFFDGVQSESSGPHAENHSKLSYTAKKLRQWTRTIVIKVKLEYLAHEPHTHYYPISSYTWLASSSSPYLLLQCTSSLLCFNLINEVIRLSRWNSSTTVV